MERCRRTSENVIERIHPITEISFVLLNQKEISISFGNGFKETFKADGSEDSYFSNPTIIEKSENNQVYEVCKIEGNCQKNVWKRWKSLLESQDFTIDSLIFEFKVADNPCLYNYSPPISSEIIDCQNLKITGKRDPWLTFPIIRFMKPKIKNLHIEQIGFSYQLSVTFGTLIQVKTAEKLYCTIAMKKEEVMKLEGYDISIDSLYFNECFVSNIMKKSIETGSPLKFRVFRGGKNPEGVLKEFHSTVWTEEISKKYDFEYEYFPGCKYYLVSLPSHFIYLFVEFCNGRQDVFGCILTEK